MPLKLSLKQMGKNLMLICVVTGIYFLLGLLGLLFRTDDVIWLIMPSSGLALAAVLLFGWRIIPSIALGNVGVCAWFFNFNSAYGYFYALSAIGASLSAWLAASLVRKYVGFPEPLLESKKILLFLCFAGPAGYLFSAFVGALALMITGLISPEELPLTMLNWWLADVLGILIFCPIVLVLFAEPHDFWKRRRTGVALPIVLTFLLTIMLYFFNNNISEASYSQELQKKTISLSEALQERIRLELQAIHALRTIMFSTNTIGTEEFTLLTKYSLFTFKEFQSIRWVNMKGADPGKVNDLVLHGQNTLNSGELLAIPSSVKDKLQNPVTTAENDQLVIEKDAYKLYSPVTSGVGTNKVLQGVIVTTVSAGGLVQQAIDKLNTPHCPITIRTSDAVSNNTRIIFSNAGGPGHEPCHNIDFNLLGQMWHLSFYHDWNGEMMKVYPSNKWMTNSGFWLTGLLGLVLMHLTGRNFQAEAMIEERTKVLTETKVAAEQANQSKNQFLAKISHELRTPLNGISGFTQLLEKKPNLTAEDRKQVAIIKQCGDDLLGLINDILDISAMETQQIKLENTKFNFSQLLHDTVRIGKLKADRKKISLIVQDTGLPGEFIGDEKRVRQILVNLIDNAIKYTRQGSVTVSATYSGGGLQISVADTGIGIAQSDIERIFSPFIQVSTNGYTHDGIGLGLSIIRELAFLMKGQMDLKSELGLGSVFTVSLPLPVAALHPANLASAVSDPALKQKNAYVIVVDDSEINLIFLTSMLEQLGCRVDSAKNGLEALALMEKNNYQLALIDINMPVMGGIELVKNLHGRDTKPKLVAVSAYVDELQISEALRAGFDAYITKPIEENQMAELIEVSNV